MHMVKAVLVKNLHGSRATFTEWGRHVMWDSAGLTNPYIIDEPIRTADDFYGRDAEIATLITRVRRGTSTVILSPPRMGATSLLNRLLQPDVLASLGDIVAGVELIDCADRIRYPLDFYRRVAQALQAAEPALALDPCVDDERILADDLTYAIRHADRRWILLLDNFEALSEFPASFFDHLRACANDGKPVFILTTRVPLDELRLATNGGSPFGNAIPVLRLGAWTDDELDIFLAATSQQSGIDLRRYRADVVRLVGRVPAFAQHVAATLYEVAASHPIDVEALMPTLAESLRETFDQVWNSPSLRLAERDLLIALVYGSRPALANGTAAAAASLTRAGLLTPDGDIVSRLFADYLRATVPRVFIQPAARKVLIAGRSRTLPRRDFDLLLFLYSNASMVCETEDILESVWGLPRDRQGPGDATMVYQRIRALRQEVEENPKKPRHILNVPGTGYRFENYSPLD